MLDSATVLDCLCAGFRYDEREYMAYDGDFYAVDPDFVRRINEAVLRVEGWEYALPAYMGGSEATYNGQVGRARPSEFLVLDTELLKFVGEYGIEACDLLHVTGAMIHVKRKGKSSKLSHLFFQATNSCRALHDSPEACRQLRLMAEKAAPAGELREGILQALGSLGAGYRGQEIVFAIVGDWRRRDATALPLLSKISLIQAVERVAALGFTPRLQLVSS